jgi:hypothetical protein
MPQPYHCSNQWSKPQEFHKDTHPLRYGILF